MDEILREEVVWDRLRTLGESFPLSRGSVMKPRRGKSDPFSSTFDLDLECKFKDHPTVTSVLEPKP